MLAVPCPEAPALLLQVSCLLAAPLLSPHHWGGCIGVFSQLSILGLLIFAILISLILFLKNQRRKLFQQLYFSAKPKQLSLLFEYFIYSFNLTIFIPPTIRFHDNSIQKTETNILTKNVVLKIEDFVNPNINKRLSNNLLQAYFTKTTKVPNP